MIILTAKINRGKILLCILSALTLFSAAVLLFVRPHFSSASTFQETSPSLNTNAGRIAFLQKYGWQISETPITEEEVMIPENLEQTSTAYCALQAQQGFPIVEYQGKTVTRYTYAVQNYPTGETNVQANLFLYNGVVIGGEICNPALDGWMHGLNMPSN